MLGTGLLRRWIVVVAMFASGCGGGGGGGGTGGSVGGGGSTTPPASVSVTSSIIEPLNVQINEDASYATFSLLTTQQGTTDLSVVPNVTYDTAHLVLDPITSPAAGQWLVSFKTRAGLGLGDYSGQITFRLCQDTACTTPHAGASVTLPYRVSITSDWQTWQKSARHTGYVRLTIDPARITKSWEHAEVAATSSSAGAVSLTRIAADASRVYFGISGALSRPTTGVLVRASFLKALDLRTGATAWVTDLGTDPGETGYTYHGEDSVGDPALSNGKVYIAGRWDQATGIMAHPRFTVVDSTTGDILSRRNFESQGSIFLAPTPYSGGIFSASGQYGGVVFAHKQSDMTQSWTATASDPSIWHTETPAVDGDQVFYYNGTGLDVFRRSDGGVAFSIADPHTVDASYDYGGAPMVLDDGSVVALSGTSGPQYVVGSQYNRDRPLKRYALGARAISWESVDTYTLPPAAKGETIFAGKSDPARIDAINAATGTVSWSWHPPADDTSKLRNNLVVTENLLFVSTETRLYGIRLADRVVVWTHPSGGLTAIAPGHVLLVLETEGEDARSNRRLVAYDLN